MEEVKSTGIGFFERYLSVWVILHESRVPSYISENIKLYQ